MKLIVLLLLLTLCACATTTSKPGPGADWKEQNRDFTCQGAALANAHMHCPSGTF
jgi:hypothetical protein